MHKSGHESLKIPPLRLLAWETTRRCNLACLHCRAAAGSGPYPGELTTAEGLTLLDDLATMGQPVVILTGGEPLLRDDIFELAAHGHGQGLRMVMAVNGTLLTPAIAARLKEVGIQRLSISIDGASAASHDQLRAVPGAYDGALAGIAACREAGLPFQINTTVTRANRQELPAIHELAIKLGSRGPPCLRAGAHRPGRRADPGPVGAPRRNTKRPCAGCWRGSGKASCSSSPPAPRSSTGCGARTPRPGARRSPRPPTAWRP